MSLPAAVLGAVALLLGSGTGPALARDNFRALRYRMVEEYIEQEGVSNRRVLEAMRTVPRHKFVRPQDRSQAYHDTALAIGYRQTISPPFIVAYMTETIDPQPDDKVLEIGTGSGYQAAVLAELADEVYTIEIVEPLGRQAAARLERLGYENVTVKVGDGYKGWPEHAPFDKIIVTCSPEDVPQPLVEQLKEGGRMIIPLGRRYQQVFYLFEKKDGKLVKRRLIPTLFVPMTGISEKQRDVKPDPLNPRIVNGGFELDENEDGLADGWHYQRETELVEENAKHGRRYLCFENRERGRVAQALQGMAVDGEKLAGLKVSLWTRTQRVVPGREPVQKPALVVLFYDSTRRPIAHAVVGPWLGTNGWTHETARIRVPADAREMIVRIGLNGARGRLCVDDVQLAPIRR